MAPKRAACQVCQSTESKYTCAKCLIVYCSVVCYKKHQETCSGKQIQPTASSSQNMATLSEDRADALSKSSIAASAQTHADTPQPEAREPPLRPLASLKWPYVPEESAFPDPLKRDDPKPLQLPQYEAIATSPAIRRVLASNPRLREILRSIDSLRGEDRELALHEALGIGESRGKILIGRESEEDQKALRDLAEAVEAAVRGGKQDALGLDWGD
ncbi:hypothetical protein OH77DRAFT_1587650 [Trametes cingulata]|nr:hypothetical protein OH77DRAFT_1587650 [Trametes cingulata]